MDIMEAWNRYKGNQDHAAWERLVAQYAALVRHVAGRLRLMLPAHVEYDDLVGSGVFGLLSAIERFEPERGVKFETFATSRIRGAILDSLRAADWAPRLPPAGTGYRSALALWERRSGRPATTAEVSAELGIDRKELYELNAK